MNFSKKVISFLALLSAPCITQAATLYADTDGDGVTDTITSVGTTNSNYIKIYHPNIGTTSYYQLGSGLTSFSMVGTTNADGFAGQEVVVKATSWVNSVIYIISDAGATTRIYDLGSGLANFSVVSINNNTNGVVGNEIIVRTESSSTIPTTSLNVIDDRRAVMRRYAFGTGLTSVKVVSVTDTNGLTGDEIVMQLESSSGIRTIAIQIIDDAKATTRQYNQSNGLQTFTVQAIRDYDGRAGAEVCYQGSTYYSTYYQMIVDRTGSVVSRSSC